MSRILCMLVISHLHTHNARIDRTYDIFTPAVAEMDALIGPPFNVRSTSRDLQFVEDIAVEWGRLVIPSAEYPAVALPFPCIR